MITARIELHVHTVLSPCAGVEMIPPVIVTRALETGLDCIFITDHNATGNCAAVMEAAQGTPLLVLPGMELQTREDVHLLCLFDTIGQLAAWQAIVDAQLPHLENDPEKIGEQYLVDYTGDLLGEEKRLLIVSCHMTLEQAVSGVRALGGLPIPAHVDRQAFGLLPTLGFVPPGLEVEVLEVSRRCPPLEARRRFPQIQRYPLVLGGDVHYAADFQSVNLYQVEALTVQDIEWAVMGVKGRSLRATE